MKQLALILLLAALSILCFADINEYYSFNATTGTYVPITGTPIDTILSDDALSGAIPIGFSFAYGDAAYTEVVVSSNGWIGLGTSLTNSNLTNSLNSETWLPVLAPLWDDTSLASGTAAYIMAGTAPNRTFTIQYSSLAWNYNGTTSYNMQVKIYETGKIGFHYGSNTGAPNNPSASIGINMSPGGTDWFYSVSPGAAATVSQTVENITIADFPADGTIYEFIPTVAAQNDLAAMSLSGNQTPSVGTPNIYTVTIRNRGSNAQSTYQVKLISSTGVELASVNGSNIQPGAVLSIPVTWTPTTEGPIILRGKVVLAGDQNTANDISSPLSVTVMPAGMTVITIGNGDELARVPIDMYWRNSLFETMYYPAEIGMVGSISALTFYNNFVTDLPNMPVKIWLGTSQQADLSAGWIPSTQLSLVFDGTVNFPIGQNPILIPLQTVYTYTGGNLVMMVNRPMDTQYYSSENQFQSQTVGATRSRNIYSDSTLFDPASPPADATLSGQFPKTSIHLVPLGNDPLTLISPTTVNYGQVLINSVNSRQISILNAGGGTLTINGVSLSGSPFFSISNPPATPQNLVTGQTIQLNLLYSPTTAGDHTGTLQVTDNLNRVIHSVPLTASCLDNTIYTLPYLQNFDAVTAPVLPLQWNKLVQSNSAGAGVKTYATNSFSAPNCVQLFNEMDAAANLLLIAPPYANALPVNNSRVNFRARSESVGANLVVGILANPLDEESFTPVQSLTLTNVWTEYVVNFASYTGAGRYVAFKHGLSGTYVSLYVDNVMLEVIPQNDLAVLSLSGNATPSVGNATTYTASVYNWGTAAQNAYTVKLYNAANVELASAAGISVGTDETVQVQLLWTPSTQGVEQLYAKVLLTGDQNPLNDASPVLAVTVMPAGMMVATIGSGTEAMRMPVDMFYQNSLFETMFYPQEIGVFGTITAITFYNNFITDLPNKPTKIWLGSSQVADLSAGWIPSGQLSQVFDGTVNYPSGQNSITIQLQNPFTYAGGNLVMMVNRPMDTTYFSSQDVFYGTTGTVMRTRNVWSDWTEYFPATPPDTNPTVQFPNTSLHLTPLGPDPIFSINPGSRNFGTVLLNSTHNQTFSIMNAGGSPLTINTISIAGSPFFSLQNMPTLPSSLNTGQSISFTGRYNPTAVGTHNATITINDHLRVSLGTRQANSRTPHAVELSGTCVDPTIISLPYLQNFDTVTAPALPVQWSTIAVGSSTQSIVSSTNDPFSAPNCVVMNNAGDTASTLLLIAPPYATTIATNTTRVNFKAKASGDAVSIFVGVMTNPQDAATFTQVQLVTLSSEWAEYVVSLGAYAGTGKTVAFKHGQAGQWQQIFFDNVMLETIPQTDLAALTITGNTTPTVGMATSYTVNVYNWGSVAQNTYQVKLYKQGGVEIASADGTAVSAGQTVAVSVGWTPDTQGVNTIYAKIVLTGDQNNLNDQSPNLTVTVQPAGQVVFTIGDGSETGRIPLDMYYMNSLYECMYYPAEISNTIGTINGIGFYNNFVTDLPNQPTNIWVGTTTQADLSASWIPSTQLTQVFSGTVNYPSGQNLIHIPFSTPYLYLNGENLVVMVERPMDTAYYSSSDLFQTQTGAQMRARNAYSDGIDFDPASPPDGTAGAVFPKTSLFILPGGVGHLNGVITGAANVPLAGVAIASTTGGYTATTNAQGEYSIINIVAGTYQFSYSRYGYLTQTETIVIPEDETVSHNVNLTQMATVNVSGTIIASDTSAGLSGAGIHLVGYEDYSTSSNAVGLFSIPGVYANQEYSFTIIRPGYQNHAGTINVGAGNYSFGNVTLNEVAYAPRTVQGEIIENNTQVNLSWQAPDPTALDVMESFEGDSFPPANWTQTITNTGAQVSGVYPTWCRFNTVSINGQPVSPTEGNNQSGLWWSYEHQDEWLLTPSFNCPPSAYLNFDSYVFLGSDSGDHYYVKLSTDNGNSWTVLWDASAQTGGWNYYDAPINIDLSLYEGMQLKIAWQADDPATNDGIWYVWFIDNIYIGNAVSAVRFQPSDLQSISAAGNINGSASPSRGFSAADRNSKSPISQAPTISAPAFAAAVTRSIATNSRALTGYLVWRLVTGQETEQTSWVSLTPNPIAALTTIDPNWFSLANGSYRWAVKAVYTGGVLSVPAFSNILQKQVINGFISGFVRTTTNAPIPAASVSAGSYSATTNSVGAYSIQLPIGTYSVTASKTGFISQTVQDVSVNANQSTTANFNLTAGSDLIDELTPITATALTGNYPNPFNPSTTISLALKDPATLVLNIYNVKGQLVRNLMDAPMPEGYHKLLWDGKDNNGFAVGSGIYYYRMQAGKYQSTRKMLLME